MTEQLLPEQIIPIFSERLLLASDKNTHEIAELLQRPSKLCYTRFVINLMRTLDVQ